MVPSLFPQVRVARSVWTRLGNALTVNAKEGGLYLTVTGASGLFLRRAKLFFQEHDEQEEGKRNSLIRRTNNGTFFGQVTILWFSYLQKKELKTLYSPSVVGNVK